MPVGYFHQGYPLDDRKPAPTLWRPSGWRDNAFFVKLCQLTDDALAVSVFSQTGATPIPILFFTQDAPCMVFAHSRYSGIQLVDSNTHTLDIPNLHFGEQIQQVGDTDAAPITSLVTGATVTPADAEQGERITGTTPNGGVEVSGYAYELALADQSLQDDGQADIAPVIGVFVIAQSGVVMGPNSTGEPLAYDGTNVAHASATAVILRESDYTQAMRDAGNVYTDTNGLVIRIMGLHAIPA